MNRPQFVSASAYKDEILALPVDDIDAASAWYSQHFGMQEIERRESPNLVAIMERDSVQIGFAINGRDPSQEGAAIRVQHIEDIQSEFTRRGLAPGKLQIDERDGRRLKAFFVVAPDGLCYYFHEPMSE